MNEEIRNKIIKTAKAVNALNVEDPDGNRIKHAKFRGMVEMYEMITGEDVKYIRFRDKDDNTYRIAKIVFEDCEVKL